MVRLRNQPVCAVLHVSSYIMLCTPYTKHTTYVYPGAGETLAALIIISYCIKHNESDNSQSCLGSFWNLVLHRKLFACVCYYLSLICHCTILTVIGFWNKNALHQLNVDIWHDLRMKSGILNCWFF